MLNTGTGATAGYAAATLDAWAAAIVQAGSAGGAKGWNIEAVTLRLRCGNAMAPSEGEPCAAVGVELWSVGADNAPLAQIAISTQRALPVAAEGDYTWTFAVRTPVHTIPPNCKARPLRLRMRCGHCAGGGGSAVLN